MVLRETRNPVAHANVHGDMPGRTFNSNVSSAIYSTINLIVFLIVLSYAAILVLIPLTVFARSAEAMLPSPSIDRNTSPNVAHLVRPGDLNSGALLLRSTSPGKYVEAPKVATDVQIDVSGIISRVKVTQKFRNPGDGWIEGVYVFPLPEASAVDKLRMQIGNRFIEGKIRIREEARRIYEKALQEGRKASLVEQHRPNLFTNAVANIGPKEWVIVQIEYQQTIRRDSNEYRLRFPLVVAPRYNSLPNSPVGNVKSPGNGRSAPDLRPIGKSENRENSIGDNFNRFASQSQMVDSVPDRKIISPPVRHPSLSKVNPVSIQVRLNAGFKLGDVTSHHHKVSVNKIDDQSALIGLSEGTIPADRDFELTWRPEDFVEPETKIFREELDGEHYVLVMLTPHRVPNVKQFPAREVIFVVDNSGSMAGKSMDQAKKSLAVALGRLKTGDRFNIIRFDNTHKLAFVSPVDVTSDNISAARRFIEGLSAEGGTDMLPALQAALHDEAPNDQTHLRQIVFLTNGAIGNETQLFSEILKHRGRSRIFTIGIGSAPNSHVMRRAAELGRGTFTHIGSSEQVMERMTSLFQKLERPALTDLSVSWSSKEGIDVWPNPVPDLYAGEPVILTAHLSKLAGHLRIEGTLDSKPWTRMLSLKSAIKAEGVAKLWARNKISSLEAQKNLTQASQIIDKNIQEIGLEFQLVTRKTSMVAEDVTPSRPDHEQMTNTDVEVNLPAGWDFDKVFGPTQGFLLEEASLKAYKPMVKLTASKNNPQYSTSAPVRTIALPETSTLSDQNILIGVMSLIFAAMCTVTIFFWGQLKRSYSSARRIRRR